MDILWWTIILVVAASLTGGFFLARRRGGKPQAQTFEAGPWTGMRDSLDIAEAIPSKAQLIQNAYPLDAAAGGVVVGRPGYAEISDVAMGAAMQGIIGWFAPSNAAFSVIVVSSGEIWAVGAGSNPGTIKLINTATLTAAGVTLSATARVSILTFNNLLIFSDGINVPFQYTPIAVNSGVTRLTNCPALYGPMTAYYAKLFGIKASDRRTIVWSEENDPAIGYEAGGYNNAWDLTQNDQRPLTRLLGTNEALYAFRDRSITAITGAVNSDFKTTGTRAGVSETVGTTSPWSVTYVRRNLYFLDTVGRPYVVRPGGEAEPIWKDFNETVKTIKQSSLIDAITIDYTPASLLLFGVTEIGQTYPSMWMVYDTSSGEPVACAIWRGYTFTGAAIVANGGGFYRAGVLVPTALETLFHLGPTDANVYVHDVPNGSTWTDNGTAITHILKASAIGADISGERFWDRVDWELPVATTMTNTYDYVTPRGTSAGQAVSAAATAHKALGINVNARWIQPRVTHSASGEQFGVDRVRVRGIVTTDAPGNV